MTFLGNRWQVTAKSSISGGGVRSQSSTLRFKPSLIWKSSSSAVLLSIGVLLASPNLALAGKDSGEAEHLALTIPGCDPAPPSKRARLEESPGGIVAETGGAPVGTEVRDAEPPTLPPSSPESATHSAVARPSLLSNEADYLEILKLISAASKTSENQIDADLREWTLINSQGVNPRNLIPFLNSVYLLNRLTPNPDWSLELNHLEAIARANFLFHDEFTFARQDPLKITETPSGAWVLSSSRAKVWAGTFKSVYRVTLATSPTSQQYAFMRIQKPAPLSPDETNPEILGEFSEKKEVYEAAEKEAYVMRGIKKAISNEGKKPNGLLVFDFIRNQPDSSQILFIAPWFNLNDAHHSIIKKPLEPRHQLNAAQHLLEGLAFLHRHRIVHRDIKPGNILLHDTGAQIEAALADFGTAYQEGHPETAAMLEREDHICTTYRYIAPEAVERFYLKPHQATPVALDKGWTELKAKQGLSPDLPMLWNPALTQLETDQGADSWSLGVSLFELVTRFRYTAKNWSVRQSDPDRALNFLRPEQARVDFILRGMEAPELKPFIAAELIPIIKCLLRVNPASRCSPQEALEMLSKKVAEIDSNIQVLAA